MLGIGSRVDSSLIIVLIGCVSPAAWWWTGLWSCGWICVSPFLWTITKFQSSSPWCCCKGREAACIGWQFFMHLAELSNLRLSVASVRLIYFISWRFFTHKKLCIVLRGTQLLVVQDLVGNYSDCCALFMLINCWISWGTCLFFCFYFWLFTYVAVLSFFT